MVYLPYLDGVSWGRMQKRRQWQRGWTDAYLEQPAPVTLIVTARFTRAQPRGPWSLPLIAILQLQLHTNIAQV